MKKYLLLALAALFLTGCAGTTPPSVIPVDQRSAEAGGTVTRSGNPAQLIGAPLHVGDPLPDIVLVDATLKQVRLTDLRGSIVLLNFLPSLDTGVCERQAGMLAEIAPDLPEDVRIVIVSRDLPFAQARIRDQLKADKILFLSDYADARFGKSTGLLIQELMLLGRGVMVVDKSGIVRYLQVVPEVAHLPDLDKAVSVAEEMAAR